MTVGAGLEGPLLVPPPRVEVGPACKCLAWHLPESHPKGRDGHGNHELPPLCIHTHTLQVVLFRVTRGLKSLLDPLPHFSYALSAWGAHTEGSPPGTLEATQASCQSPVVAQPTV